MDWKLLLPPLIIALVPILIALIKKTMPKSIAGELGMLYPLFAPILGVLIDQGLAFLTAHQSDARYGLLYGAAGVGLREVIDQLKQLKTPRVVPIFLLSLGLLVGCSAATTQTGLATSGQALVGVGNQFVAVGALYTTNCTPTVKVAALAPFCSGFRDFAPRFQKAFPIARDAWLFAVQANDASKAQSAMTIVVDLATNLTGLAAQAAVALGDK